MPAGDRRIAIYTASLRTGGVERFAINLSAELVGRGYPVDLVLASAEGPLLKQVHHAVRMVDLGSRRVLMSLPGLVRYLRRESPSALLTLQTHCNIAGIIATTLVSEPPRLIVSEHNTLARRMDSALDKEALLLRLASRLYHKAQAVVAVSNGVAGELRRLTHLTDREIVTIYNPVVGDDLTSSADSPLDHPWFVPGAPPVVLNVGRLVPQKDQATLLRAFAKLRQRRAARLMILGEGQERRDLEKLVERLGIQADVSMPGFDSNPYRYMRRCQVFVLSSAWEGLGNALIEAMACGAPVVSTDCPSGPAEILEHGQYGPLVPPGDDAALAIAIEQVLENPLPREALNRRAAEFSTARSADAYLRILLPDTA